MEPLIATFLGTVFCLGAAWWILTRKSEPRNSYESFKQDSRRLMGVIFLGAGLFAGWLTIEQLMAPDKPVVHKVIRHRKPIARPVTPEETKEEQQ